jgi:ABC-type nitrate/sulfonate/bicarbonate transport system permease component
MTRVLGWIVVRIVMPAVSILALWYLVIIATGLPPFVIPRPERVLQPWWPTGRSSHTT